MTTACLIAQTPVDPRAPLHRVALANVAYLSQAMKEKQAETEGHRCSPPRVTYKDSGRDVRNDLAQRKVDKARERRYRQ